MPTENKPAAPVTAAEELDAVLHWRDKHTQAIRERDTLQLRLNAADQRIDELVSAVRSINRGRRHEVFVPGDDEPQYRQRKEWVDWVLSLCDEASASDRCHEIPGTSGMRLNMLANQGE